jgi:hypothetical protein
LLPADQLNLDITVNHYDDDPQRTEIEQLDIQAELVAVVRSLLSRGHTLKIVGRETLTGVFLIQKLRQLQLFPKLLDEFRRKDAIIDSQGDELEEQSDQLAKNKKTIEELKNELADEKTKVGRLECKSLLG